MDVCQLLGLMCDGFPLQLADAAAEMLGLSSSATPTASGAAVQAIFLLILYTGLHVAPQCKAVLSALTPDVHASQPPPLCHRIFL